MSVTIEVILKKRLKSYIKPPLKMESKSPVLLKGCAYLYFQTTSNGGVNYDN